jgi:hypothetical protein
MKITLYDQTRGELTFHNVDALADIDLRATPEFQGGQQRILYYNPSALIAVFAEADDQGPAAPST